MLGITSKKLSKPIHEIPVNEWETALDQIYRKVVGGHASALAIVSNTKREKNDDKEGSVIKHSDKVPTEEEIKFKVREFLGIINQVPPHASAVKVNGISAYKLHRENKKISTPYIYIQLKQNFFKKKTLRFSSIISMI